MGLFRTIFTVVHIAVIGLLLGTFLNSLISPKYFSYFNFLSLSFPILLLIHVVMMLAWLFFWRKRAFFFLLMSVMLLKPAGRWINFSPKKDEAPDLRILTYNVKARQRDGVNDYLAQSGADIIFLQEKSASNDYQLSGYKNILNNDLVGTLSKYPVLYCENLKDGNHTFCQIVDIEVNEKKLRLFNVYLEPFYFEKAEIEPAKNSDINRIKARNARRKMTKTFKVHAMEVDAVAEKIRNSPYPVIVAGDFNAVPNSYEYYQVAEHTADAFMKAGSGTSVSYPEIGIPLSIDHVFSNKGITALEYRVDRAAKASDHYPVLVNFKFDH